MKKVFLLVFVLLLVAIVNVESGLIATRYQKDNRPDCIWIWVQYPRHPPGRTTTVAPTTIPPTAATETPKTTPAPEIEAAADAGGEAAEASPSPSDVEEVTVIGDGGAK